MSEPITTIDPATRVTDGSADYTGGSVQILRDYAHIRQRPGMYIGDTGPNGLHHLVYELVYNSVDEALAGHCKNIHVHIDLDGSISCADDGRGIPVEMHPDAGIPTLQAVLTISGAGAKFDKQTYKTSAGLHGIGAKAVTALCEWAEAEVRRNGKLYQQDYERGKATSGVKEIGPAKGTGTKVSFSPDPDIFHGATFDYDRLESRLRELAFLNKGLAIKLSDARANKEDMFHYAGGVAEFVEYLNRNEETLHKAIYVEKTIDNVYVEVALQYTTGEDERARCYANNAYNHGGGTHLSGFRAALTRSLNSYGTKENLFKNNLQPIGEDFREGLTAIVSVQVPEPQFESQTKVRLNNPEVEGIVTSVVNEQLTKYLEENPKDATRIMKKVILAAEAREAAAKAKKALKDRKSILNSGGLPGKLFDCTSRDRDESELFLVEGQSAGGSAEQGRQRMFQAVLPLRGKVLNVEKARKERLLENAEICNLISAIGVDIANTDDITGLRYGKIVILTDADVDGQHIRTLLLTFFYRQMRKLVECGRIYVSRPPLYKIAVKKDVRYVQLVEEMNKELLTRGLAGTSLKLHTEPEVVLQGDRLTKLLELLDDMEHPLQILERRGIGGLAEFLKRKGPKGLPILRVVLEGSVHWFHSDEEVQAFREKEKARLGKELIVASEASSDANGQGAAFTVQELHEVKALNRGLERLHKEFNLSSADLLPALRPGGAEPKKRYTLEHGDVSFSLPHLRVLNSEIRRLGEKGMSVTRFKGLGEMDPQELWDTTLDPARRTMLQVQLDDALKADEMFRVLMGEKVEPRRDFIQKHALEVKDIDYHGA